ncbi:hypothetical protein HMPREF3212_02141 [Citrobacter freundii]|nr:hypothetical protein HMPREF3212_02141 [Citrobacter freundii]
MSVASSGTITIPMPDGGAMRLIRPTHPPPIAQSITQQISNI